MNTEHEHEWLYVNTDCRTEWFEETFECDLCGITKTKTFKYDIDGSILLENEQIEC